MKTRIVESHIPIVSIQVYDFNKLDVSKVISLRGSVNTSFCDSDKESLSFKWTVFHLGVPISINVHFLFSNLL